MAATNQYLQRYNALRRSIAARVQDPAARQRALAQFDADPRAQPLRRAAGLAPVSTANGEVRQIARQSVQQAGADAGKNSSALQGGLAGLAHIGLAGIPEMLAAAGERFLPTAITGNRTNASYSNILQMIRAKDNQQIADHPVASTVGAITGTVAGGRLAGTVISRLAGSSVPAVARAAQAAQRLTTLNKDARAANLAKLGAVGGIAGGVQAAGGGENVPIGAVEGAAAAPVVAGAGLVANKLLLRPAADILRLSNPDSYLRRFTTATSDEIRQRIADFRARTGANPTLAEVLPAADRASIAQNVIGGRPSVIEQASNAIRARSANVQPEMADVVNAATNQQRRLTQRELVQSLRDANGGTSAPDDAARALRASQSPTDMLSLRREESRRIMAPHDAAQVTDNFNDLIPQHPVTTKDGSVVMTESDPEVTRAIRSVAGNAPNNREFSVQDLTNMISDLRDDAAQGGIEGRAADRAAQHLMDVLDQNVPDAAAATQQMRDAYAAHSRMAEGMGEGWQQRLRDEIQVGTSNARSRGVQNAYDTNEGVAGRQLGQTNRLLSDLSGTPQSAISSTIDLARNGNPAISENIGQTAADQIQGAAQAQAQSMENLASMQKTASSSDGSGLNPEDITTGLLALGPHPFAKAHIVRKLLQFSILPESKARVVTDMLFSQDPRLIDRAVNALGNAPKGASFLRYLAGTTGELTSAANNAAEPNDAGNISTQPQASTTDPYADIASPAAPSEPAAAPAQPSTATDPYADIASPAAAASPSPYASVLQQKYADENPDLVNLVQRVKSQESGGDQSAVSKKGAVGVMQVMPSTAPEAARLAGVKWDPDAYRNDPAYNELLGHAYLSQLLQKYGGNVAPALAAYNAGPTAVDKALTAGPNWLALLPAETQDYVARIGQ